MCRIPRWSYGLTLPELVVSVASESGVILDTNYTGKAVLGMLSEMRVNPRRFRGNRVLFINTGVCVCLVMCSIV